MTKLVTGNMLFFGMLLVACIGIECSAPTRLARAPDFALPTLAGGTIELSELAGDRRRGSGRRLGGVSRRFMAEHEHALRALVEDPLHR